MKMIYWLLLPLLLSAQDFKSLLKLADHNLLLQAKGQEVIAKENIYEVARGKNYPALSASLQGIYLKDTPSMFFHLPMPGVPPEIKVGEQHDYTGQIALTYPIFSGFAISGLIEKSKLDARKSALEEKDAQRRLYMQIASLYGGVYSVKKALDASVKALRAIETSYQKANGFYKAGMLAPSELENIKAKKYEIKASIQQLKNQKETLLRQLSYLVNTTIKDTEALPQLHVSNDGSIISKALRSREDIQALQTLLKMDEEDIRLAKSRHYPSVALLGALKTQGKNIKLNGDGFTNPNKSYIGAAIEWKLFDGFATTHQIQAAKAKKIGRILYLKDYQNKVKTTLESALSTLHLLHIQKESKTVQLKAQNSYFKLTKGRFENHLCSADELSRAIASKAAAQAELEAINARIFVQNCKVLLEVSLQKFTRSVWG